MKRRPPATFTFIFLAIFAVAMAGAPVPSHAQQPGPAATASEPSVAVILLRNGQVLRGALQLSGDSYQITVTTGGTLRIPRQEVALISTSLAEAYRVQASRINTGDTNARLTLANWCLHQELFAEALEQVSIAQRLSPLDNRTRPLRERIEIAQRAALAARLQAAMPAPEIAPATYEELLPPAPRENPAADAQPLHSARIDQLPAGTIEDFTRVVQPILMNGCAATACHGSHSESTFRLASLDDGLRFTQESTRENLARVLAFVDEEEPTESPLLARPGTPGICTSQGVWNGAYDGRPRQIQAWIEKCYPPPPAVEDTPPASGQPATAPGQNVPASVPRLLPADTAAAASPLVQVAGQGSVPAVVEGPQAPRTDVTPSHLPTPAEAFAAQAAYESILQPAEQPKPNTPTRGAQLPDDGVRDAFDGQLFHQRLQEATERPTGH